MRLLAFVLVALPLAGGALASPCGDRVAALQARYDKAPIVAGAAPAEAATSATGAAQTTGAMLHHQPSAASDADAGGAPLSKASVRDARFKDFALQATAADHSGDAAGCETAASQAEHALAGK